jgi:hypothetical protein
VKLGPAAEFFVRDELALAPPLRARHQQDGD